MSDLFVALGLVLALEGALYALAPKTVQSLMKRALLTPAETLRLGGLIALIAGVGIVWIVRGGG